jgi:hypothetical protein
MTIAQGRVLGPDEPLGEGVVVVAVAVIVVGLFR